MSSGRSDSRRLSGSWGEPWNTQRVASLPDSLVPSVACRPSTRAALRVIEASASFSGRPQEEAMPAW